MRSWVRQKEFFKDGQGELLEDGQGELFEDGQGELLEDGQGELHEDGQGEVLGDFVARGSSFGLLSKQAVFPFIPGAISPSP